MLLVLSVACISTSLFASLRYMIYLLALSKMPPVPSWSSPSSSTSWSRSAAAGLAQLFGPATHITPPAIAWNASSFHAVDDRVRGGSSQSHAQLTAKDGQLLFSGYLDTTTLGGAGFASQQYGASPAFPITLEPAAYKGLELRVIPQETKMDTESGSSSQQGTSTGSSSNSVPGGGRGPVTSYVFNVYTSIPQRRPDGRRESSIVYEYHFDVGSTAASPADGNNAPETHVYRPQWSDFKPTYRGKPKPDAGPLKPEEIKLWSIMARSDFGSQSGPFALVVDSIWARRASETVATQVSEKGLNGRDVSQQGEWAPSLQQSLQPGNTSGARGFALYALTAMAFMAWILWAVLPDAWLHALGIDWYPSRCAR